MVAYIVPGYCFDNSTALRDSERSEPVTSRCLQPASWAREMTDGRSEG